MPIDDIHSFLIHPEKNVDEHTEISGTQIPRHGRLFEMLTRVFDRATNECNIEIIFRPDDQNRQRNECRDLLITYVENPGIDHGRSIAEKLQEVTTHRSGLGLLFLMKGSINENHKLVISRFPADQGIIALEDNLRLSVEFIERVFMKSAQAYKSALYLSDSLVRGFWHGMVIDRQISGKRDISDYWIREFLQSELRTTGPAGSQRLGKALRNAINSTPDLAQRYELLSATNLLRSRHEQRISARQMVELLGLSQEAITSLENAFPRTDLMEEVFQFDLEEFEKHVSYRSVELDNGGLMIAEDARFEEVFERQDLNIQEGRVRYVTEGHIIDEKLRKTK